MRISDLIKEFRRHRRERDFLRDVTSATDALFSFAGRSDCAGKVWDYLHDRSDEIYVTSDGWLWTVNTDDDIWYSKDNPNGIIAQYPVDIIGSTVVGTRVARVPSEIPLPKITLRPFLIYDCFFSGELERFNLYYKRIVPPEIEATFEDFGSFCEYIYRNYRELVDKCGPVGECSGLACYYSIREDRNNFEDLFYRIVVKRDLGVRLRSESDLKDLTLPSDPVRWHAVMEAFEILNLSDRVRNISFEKGFSPDVKDPLRIDSVMGDLPGGLTRFSELRRISFPDGLKTIETGCLSWSTRLQRVDLPQRLEVIGDSAFLGCRNLSAITIPSTVRKIGSCAFMESGIRNIAVPGGCEIGPDAFDRNCRCSFGRRY